MNAPPAFTPAPGGGIIPVTASATSGAVRRAVIGLVVGIMRRLPEPLNDRLALRMQRSTRPPRGIADGTPIAEETPGGVPTTWLAPELRAAGALVFLHGGSYTGGPFRQQWAWLSEIQRRTATSAAMVRYRMPPRHPFPVALDDSLAAIRALHTDGAIVDGRWILGGDSAGGGLALAVCQALRDMGGPLPAGLVLTAPWVDLTLAHPDVLALAANDTLMKAGRAMLLRSAAQYAGGVPLDDARLSPLNASMGGLPPVHLNVGTDDLFLPDIRRLRDAFAQAGVQVAMIEQEGGAHTYVQQVDTPEAEWAIRSQTEWILALLGRSGSTIVEDSTS